MPTDTAVLERVRKCFRLLQVIGGWFPFRVHVPGRGHDRYYRGTSDLEGGSRALCSRARGESVVKQQDGPALDILGRRETRVAHLIVVERGRTRIKKRPILTREPWRSPYGSFKGMRSWTLLARRDDCDGVPLLTCLSFDAADMGDQETLKQRGDLEREAVAGRLGI